MSASDEELKKLNELTDLYFKVKALGLGYYSYCPHCGSHGRHHVLMKSENGWGWQVLQLECCMCGNLWEPWICKDELILGKGEKLED